MRPHDARERVAGVDPPGLRRDRAVGDRVVAREPVVVAERAPLARDGQAVHEHAEVALAGVDLDEQSGQIRGRHGVVVGQAGAVDHGDARGVDAVGARPCSTPALIAAEGVAGSGLDRDEPGEHLGGGVVGDDERLVDELRHGRRLHLAELRGSGGSDAALDHADAAELGRERVAGPADRVGAARRGVGAGVVTVAVDHERGDVRHVAVVALLDRPARLPLVAAEVARVEDEFGERRVRGVGGPCRLDLARRGRRGARRPDRRSPCRSACGRGSRRHRRRARPNPAPSPSRRSSGCGSRARAPRAPRPRSTPS